LEQLHYFTSIQFAAIDPEDWPDDRVMARDHHGAVYRIPRFPMDWCETDFDLPDWWEYMDEMMPTFRDEYLRKKVPLKIKPWPAHA
jgi:hypothetical protein